MGVEDPAERPQRIHHHPVQPLGRGDEGVRERAVGHRDHDVVHRHAVETVHHVEADDVRARGSQGHREGTETPRTVGKHDAEEIRHDAIVPH